jgi:hypothetical protein
MFCRELDVMADNLSIRHTPCKTFLDEPRHPWLPEEDGDQRWLPVRMLQLVRRLP